MKFAHRIFTLAIAAFLALGLSLAGNPKAAADVEHWTISATMTREVSSGPCPGDGHPGIVQVSISSTDDYGNPILGRLATVELFDSLSNSAGSAQMTTGTGPHDFIVSRGGQTHVVLSVNGIVLAETSVMVFMSIADPVELVVLSMTPVTPVDADSAVDYVATASVQVCDLLVPAEAGLEFDISAPATISPLPQDQDWTRRVYVRAEQAATSSLVARSTVYGRQQTATVRFGVAAPTIETATAWGVTGKVFQAVPSVTLQLPAGSVPATATATITNCQTTGSNPPTTVCDWSWPAGSAQLSAGEFSAIAVDAAGNVSAPATGTLGSGSFTLTLAAQLTDSPYTDPCTGQPHLGRVAVQLAGNTSGQEVEVRGVNKITGATVAATLTTDSQGNANTSWPITDPGGWSFTAWIGQFQVADGETIGGVVTDFAPNLSLSHTPAGPVPADDPNGYTLTATVTCGNDNIPLPNVQVDFTSKAGLQQVNTDADGKASIQVTATVPGDVEVNVTAHWQFGRSATTALSFVEPSVATPGGGGPTADTGGQLVGLVWPLAGLLALAAAAGLTTALGLRARRR